MRKTVLLNRLKFSERIRDVIGAYQNTSLFRPEHINWDLIFVPHFVIQIRNISVPIQYQLQVKITIKLN